MLLADFLGVVFDALPPNIGVLELTNKIPVDLLAEIPDSGPPSGQNDWLFVVGNLPFGLGIDPDHIEVVPDRVQELFHVPSLVP